MKNIPGLRALLLLMLCICGLYSSAAEGDPSIPFDSTKVNSYPVADSIPSYQNTAIICEGNPIKLKYNNTADPNPASLTYEWYKEEQGTTAIVTAASGTGKNTYQEANPKPGKYIYKLRMVNANNCASEEAFFTVYVLPALTITLPSNQEMCAATTGNTTDAKEMTRDIKSIIPYTSIFKYTYSWNEKTPTNTAGSDISTAKDITVKDKVDTGDYTYTVTVKYDQSVYKLLGDICSTSETRTIKVIPVPGKPSITPNY